MGRDLVRQPIEWRIARLAGSLRRASVFGEVEVGMNRVDLANRSCLYLIASVMHSREKVPIPHQKPYAASLHRRHQPFGFAAFGRQRFILHDMHAGHRCSDAQLTMPLGFRANDGDLDAKFTERPLDVAEIGNLPSIRKLLVPLVRPVRHVRIISNDH